MKKITLLFLLVTVGMFLSCSNEPNPCLMAYDFILQDLTYPEEAEHSIYDCTKEKNTDNSYTIWTKVKASNVFGVKSTLVYKVRLTYNGGVATDINNWRLIKIESESL